MLTVDDPTSPAGSADVIRIKLDIAYDGRDFSGWAPQPKPGLRTVAGVLAETLGRVLRLPEPPTLTVAGRTDAGVHARGQVAHVDLPADAWAEASRQRGRALPLAAEIDELASRRLLRRLGGALPPDIRVRGLGRAPEGFDARFSALWRRYSYRVCDTAATADPLHRHDTLWHLKPLDLDAMNTAAARLTGEHDFAAFCRRREGATTIRALRWLDWHRDPDGIAVARVIADAFCHNMVRSLVGALLPVGEGARPVSWPAALLAAGVRDPAVRVAPPHPLCLEEVRYPPDADLASRADQARRIRVLGGPPA
ncbi:MAG: tRNA pseudouridine(38-40) synthase TruA [Nocardiopsaceae bacterium]|nr:tRNA pseudouridine(38-40) synthase TruA [Nocardiopsaceae bacterium]